MNKRYSGGITVFFSMTISVLILLFTALFFCEQYMVARLRGKQAMDLCGQSVLGGYVDVLQQEYGLYAMQSAETASEDLQYFWNLNMERYEDPTGELTVDSVLSDPEIFKKQIKEFMKYYAVEDLVKDYSDLLDQVQQNSEDMEDLEEGVTAASLMETYLKYFASTVEYLEGVDQYGGRYERSISNLWNESWTRDSLKELIKGSGNDGSFNAWMQYIDEYRILNEEALESFQAMCDEGERIRPELEALLEEAETEEMIEELQKILKSLHDGNQDDQEKLSMLEENCDILQKASQGMELLLENPESGEGKEKSEQIFSYHTDISIPYELRNGSGGRDWDELWNDLQKYVTDLSEYAEDRYLLTEEERALLPSLGQEEEAVEEDLMNQSDTFCSNLDQLTEGSLQKVFEIEYAFHVFQDLTTRISDDKVNEDKFFQNEIEYILGGSSNELKNLEYVRNRILVIRFVFNVAFLMTDGEKQKIIKTAAALTGGLIAPGIGNLIAEAIIIACWGAAESYCDYEKLIHGSKVPLVKTKDTWQTDLEHIDQLSWDSEAYKKGSGLSYQDYEKVLLLFEDQTVLEKRMMDLIQLNLQKKTGEKMYLKDMVTGFTCKMNYTFSRIALSTEGSYAYE